MLVLLPPSEGKAKVESGPALDLEALRLPALTAARRAVLDELVELCSQDEEKAREVLGLSHGLRAEVAVNAALHGAATRPAGEIYTGVLYDSLDLATLDADARARARESLLIFSGLWGAVAVDDPIPAYRCSGNIKLPGVGGLGPYWREPLEEVLPDAAGEGLVLDLRSAAYGAMWKPSGALAERTATVRVLHSRLVSGVEKRTVVSHFNKATKGRLVRALLRTDASRAPRTPEELATHLGELGFRVETAPPTRAGRTWQLDVVVTDVH
ncbi:peroxide stress protein YaaA [Streptomyces sp. XM4193]|uniref:peroxide stress protein YaaA n=1 Tax=Streptomyces sp. XM4193 TaxID=2929782 RepID=UPI001FF87D00|nr:peroxide stress protein YaaA [Streptomyces sp. XM4193]MCK1796149.1 peroxide stress protein YaaA [Streptomyces sp. XM4193]